MMQCVWFVYVENMNWQFVVMSQCECCQIYYFQFFIQYFVVGQLIVYGCGRIFCWIGSEYIIYFGCFQYDICFNFDFVQIGCRVGSEEWVICICRQNYNMVIMQQVNSFGLIVVVVYVV